MLILKFVKITAIETMLQTIITLSISNIDQLSFHPKSHLKYKTKKTSRTTSSFVFLFFKLLTFEPLKSFLKFIVLLVRILFFEYFIFGEVIFQLDNRDLCNIRNSRTPSDTYELREL